MFQQLLRRAVCACSTKPRRGSPAALPGEGIKQEKNCFNNVQRISVNITGFI
jgi:hypothetical protein